MQKIASFIVDKRVVILILFLFIIAYCVWGMGQVEVEYDITTYLPESTDTKRALAIMDEEFESFGTTTVMIKNVTFSEADSIYEQVKDLEGVKMFSFENTEDYYRESCALFSVTFEGDKEHAPSLAAYNKLVSLLEPYETYTSVALTDSFIDMLEREVSVILVVVVFIIIAVVIFTSQSILEFVVFLITFLVAALMNMGTNFWLGKISFISNTVCVILQLALAIDYAIILSHRFAEEKERGLAPVDAVKAALGKAIIEISSSSLTTIAGLLALTTMSLRLGYDMGIVLAKSIVCSMIAVFLFMPGLMLLFSRLIDKTRHKSFVPKIPFVGRLAVKGRFPIIALFLALFIVGGVLSFSTKYVYYSNSIDTPRPSSVQIAEREINAVFDQTTEFVVLMPGKDYERQKKAMDRILEYPEITDALGLPNTEVSMNGVTVYLTEGINYKRLADLLAADEDVADAIFTAYTLFSEDEMEDGISESALYQANKDIYKASLLDLCDCAFEYDDFIAAYLYYDEDSYESYTEIKDLIEEAKKQLVGENWCRLLFVVDGAVESEETFDLIARLLAEVKAEFPEAVFAGNAMSAYDLNESFAGDNLKVSLVTVILVFVILMFTFRSWGLPVVLTLTIQGSIFVNFAYYTVTGTNLFFFVYLIISAIQMGATIDYAIVVTNRFMELKPTLGKREALITALSDAFPTVLTSGLIMASAGFLIGMIVSEPMISTMGDCLGRGVIVSTVSVMILLPALLYVFDGALERSAWRKKEGSVCFFDRIKSLFSHRKEG